MADTDPAGFAQRFLVKRWRDDGADLVVERVARGALDVFVSRPTDLGADVAAADLLDVDVLKVDQVDDALSLAGFGGCRDGADLERRAGDANGCFERASLADDEWPCLVVDARVGE